MLSKLFRRKAEPLDLSPQAIQDICPKVGEVRKGISEETLYLAPLPVYTGQIPAPLHNFSEVNDAYLELGGSNLGMVFQGKMLAWVIWLSLSMLVLMPVMLSTMLYLMAPESSAKTFWNLLGTSLQVAWTCLLLPALAPVGICVRITISQTRKQALQYPLRFNRQRREVCFINSETHKILIVPWEKVTAWVSNSEMATEYGSTSFHTFGLALENEETGMMQPILFGKPSQLHAIGTWEAIRQYMEHGIPDPAGQLSPYGRIPTEYELRPYEGLHTWEVEKRRKEELGGLHSCFTDEERADIGLPRRTRWPLRRWYIWRVLSFWKMPYMIAEWGHTAGKPWIPEKVRDWSAPIPKEQWAKPSPELLKASQIVEQAMSRKKNKLDFVAACKLINNKTK